MTLEQISQKLKSARDGSGLSLSQIQEKTKIPFSHLSAIDAGNFDDLPEPVYVSGFIRRYAECVGLDSQSLVDEYRNELDSLTPPPAKSGFLFKNNKASTSNNVPTAYYNRQAIESSPPNLIKLIPFYALWIILITGLIIYLVNRQGALDMSQQDSALITLRQSNASLNLGKNANTQEAGSIANSQSTDNSANDSTVSSDNNDEHITLTAKNHVWVEVKAISNGESLFNGFLEGGDTRDYSDKEGLRIRAGNGGNVTITSAGKSAPLGLSGKIGEKTFAVKNNQIAESKSESVADQASDSKTISSNATTSAKKKPTDTADSAKKPSDSITNSTTKKAALATATNTHSAKEDVSTRLKNSADRQDNLRNLDVPYRYSE